jgi:hypothetical protein
MKQESKFEIARLLTQSYFDSLTLEESEELAALGFIHLITEAIKAMKRDVASSCRPYLAALQTTEHFHEALRNAKAVHGRLGERDIAFKRLLAHALQTYEAMQSS